MTTAIKKLKSSSQKLIAIVASVLLVAMLVPAVALGVGTGKITIDNPKAGEDYKAYKIFDVVYNNDESAYSYTIDSTNKWLATVRAYADTEGNGMTVTQAAGQETKYVVETTGDFSAAKFADVLKQALSEMSSKPESVPLNGDSSKVAGNLDLGYYFVTTGSGALCNLTTTNSEVTIHDKNDVPFEKTVSDPSVEVGQTVEYVITGTVPDTTGFETYTYRIADKMSAGLTFKGDVKVYINGTQVTEGFSLKTGNDAGDKDFILEFTNIKSLSFGDKIEVKYSATVNEAAISQISTNTATLEYSNNPSNSTQTTTKTSEKDVYSATIVINKYAEKSDKDDKTEKLSDAKFVLYKEVDGVRSYYKYTEPVPATESTPEVQAKVEWVEEQTDATEVSTDKDGAATFEGLKDGTYQLLETVAPDGYNLKTSPTSVTISGASATKTDLSSLTMTQDVANNTGAELPSTGGIGTTIFYVAGAILIIGAIAALIIKRRNAKQAE